MINLEFRELRSRKKNSGSFSLEFRKVNHHEYEKKEGIRKKKIKKDTTERR